MAAKNIPLHQLESSPFLPPSQQPSIIITNQKLNDQVAYPASSDQESRQNGGHKPNASNGHSRTEARKGCSNYIGILLALLAGLIFTVGTVLVKYMKHYHPFTLAVYRLQGVMIPSIFMVLYAHRVQKIQIFKPFWPANTKEKAKKLIGIILRASLGCTALFLHFFALQYLQVGDVAVLSSCKPIFVTIAAFFLLGESFGFFPVLMALLTMVGVGVITRPPMLTGQDAFDEGTLMGIGFALASVVTDTMVVVIIRYLREIHVSVMMVFLGFWGTIQSVICAYSVDQLKLPESGTDWVLAIGLAATALLNQVAMNLALQFEIASTVALTRTMDIVFAFVLQFLIMSIAPDLFSVSGAIVIITCVLLTAYRKWLMTLPKTHSSRKRCWLILY